MTKLELPTIEHTFYDCLIDIEQCYSSKSKVVYMENEWIQSTGRLVDIFERLPRKNLSKYMKEARDVLSKLYGTEELISRLEKIAGDESA